MKMSEIMKKYRKQIAEEMVRLYRKVLERNGEIQFKIYISEDGTIDNIEEPQGGNSYYDSPNLFYVTTISAPCFDPLDEVEPEDIPEDEEQRKELEASIIDANVEQYDNCCDSAVGMLIHTCEEIEQYEML